MECIFRNDNNCKVKLPPSADSKLCKKFIARDNSEIIFRRIHSYLIRNNMIQNNIIDTGCWIGDNSIPWAMQIGGIVYAIDPSSSNLTFIKQICRINRLKNVKTIQKAVSNKREFLYSSRIKKTHYTFNSSRVGKYKFEAVSLDYLYETNQIENISLIHLDVEGFEAKVIAGSEKIIKTYRPIISFEQHITTDPYVHLINFFVSINYEVYLIDEVLPGCLPDCRNFIAFPSELRFDVDKNTRRARSGIFSLILRIILIRKLRRVEDKGVKRF